MDLFKSKALRICVAYATISVLISLTYKQVLSGYLYDAKNLMLAQQLLVS